MESRRSTAQEKRYSNKKSRHIQKHTICGGKCKLFSLKNGYRRAWICIIGWLLMMLLSLPLGAVAGSPEESAVVQMDIKFTCGCKWTGTGTMICTNAMITAGHNLVCYVHNKPLDTCTCYFGRSGSKYTYKYNGAFTFYWFSDFSDGYESEDDIGYVIFPTDIGKKTGWYASSAESDDDLEWEYCHLMGYNGNVRLNDWAQANIVSSKLISLDASPAYRNGNQGGPVYYANEGLEYPTVVAVYITCSDTTAYARRLTKDIFDDMRKNGARFN